MGKIILEFDSIEESVEARNALDGTKWKIAMWDLDQILRSVERHDVSLFGNHEASEEEYKVCVKIREEMRKILIRLVLIWKINVFNSMKIIVTKEQHEVINEALGVPNSILEAAEDLYGVFADNLRSITDKEREYDFQGDLDIVLGDKKKIRIDEYNLKIEVNEDEDFTSKVAIASMGMGQQFRFDRDIMMKTTAQSTTADFSITYIVLPEWEPKDLYEEFIRDRDRTIGSLAHELKHKYDKQVKPIDLIGKDAEYAAIERLPPFLIPEVDEKFVRYIYFTDIAEDLVRSTEVASNIRSKGIKKSEFREFLKNNKTFQNLVEIKNFTFEKLIRGIYNNIDTVDMIFDKIDVDTDGMSTKDKVKKFLTIIYVNIANLKLEVFSDYVSDSEDLFKQFLRSMGSSFPEDDKVDKILLNFQKHVIKYKDNPLQFFKSEIDRFHKVSDQTMRKISKLYAMAKDDIKMNESIIDWELHKKLVQKKYGERPIETEFKFVNEDKQSKIEDIRQMIKDPHQFETMVKYMGIENLIKIVYDGDIIKFSEDTTTPMAYLSTDGMNLYLHSALVDQLGLENLNSYTNFSMKKNLR
jgi:hypothetical protein